MSKEFIFRWKDVDSQCDRILARLKIGPCTTWDIGPALGILCPTRRIFELRKRYEITSTEQWKGRTRIVTYHLEVDNAA